jgi:hypothetical protein
MDHGVRTREKLDPPDQPNSLVGSVRMKWHQSSVSLGVRKGSRTKSRSIYSYWNCEVNAFGMNTCTKRVGGYPPAFSNTTSGHPEKLSSPASGDPGSRFCARSGANEGSALMLIRTSAVGAFKSAKYPGIILLHERTEQLPTNDSLAEKQRGEGGRACET